MNLVQKIPKRKPGAGEYIDLAGKLRTSKGRINHFDSRKLLDAKIRHAEQSVSRKELHKNILILQPDNIIGEGLPYLEARIGERRIAWASRGHRATIRFERKGLFRVMLGEIEKREKTMCEFEGVEKYRAMQFNYISKEVKLSREMVNFFNAQPKPVYIDYTKVPSVALALIKCGYTLAPQSFRELQRIGEVQSFEKSELIKYFLKTEKTPYAKPLFFTKKMK